MEPFLVVGKNDQGGEDGFPPACDRESSAALQGTWGLRHSSQL